MKSANKHTKHIFPIAVIFLAIAYFYWDGLKQGYAYLPIDTANNNLPWLSGNPKPLQNWLVSADPLYQFYPFSVRVDKAVHNGRLLFWDHSIFLGHPSFADPLYQTFYPLLRPFTFLFGAAKGLTIGLWLHVFLAAVFMYALLKINDCSDAASVAGGIIYSLGGFLVTWFETTFWTTTLSLLPGVLLFYSLSLQRKCISDSVVAGVILGLAILAGQFQFILVFLLFVSLVVMGLTLQAYWKNYGDVWWPTTSFLVLCLLGGLFSGIQTFPFLEFLPETRRVVSEGLLDPLPLRQLISLLVPNYFGNPTDGGYWGFSNYNEAIIYASVPGIFLASTILLGSWRGFIWLCGLLCVIYFICGGPGVSFLNSLPVIKYISLHRSIYLIPLFTGFLAAQAISHKGIPAVTIFVSAVLFICALAGAWMIKPDNPDLISNLQQEFAYSLCFVGFTVLLMIGIRFVSWLEWGFPILIYTSLAIWGRDYNPSGKIDNLLPSTPLLEFLSENVENHERVMALQQNNRLIFGPNILGVFSIFEPGGYSSFVNTDYHNLVTKADPDIDMWWANRYGNMILFSEPASRFLDFANIRYIVSKEAINEYAPVAEFVNSGCMTHSSEITNRLPVSGTFLVQDFAINRFDIEYFTESEVDENASINVEIRQVTDEDPPIMQATNLGVDIVSDKRQTYYFAPEKDAPGNKYRWEVSTDSTRSGIHLCKSTDSTHSVSLYGIEYIKVFEENGIIIYERLSPFPYSYVAYQSQTVVDKTDTIEMFFDNDFALRNIVLISEDPEIDSTTKQPSHSATTVNITAESIEIYAMARQDAILVASTQYHPGWKATVNGVSKPIHRVNQIFMGVPIDAGENHVELKFRPDSLKAGSFVTLAGIFVALMFLGYRRVPFMQTTKNKDSSYDIRSTRPHPRLPRHCWTR